MARLDTSKAGELRVMAERLRRRAQEMTLLNYFEMMVEAADALDRQARLIEDDEHRAPGYQFDIRV